MASLIPPAAQLRGLSLSLGARLAAGGLSRPKTFAPSPSDPAGASGNLVVEVRYASMHIVFGVLLDKVPLPSSVASWPRRRPDSYLLGHARVLDRSPSRSDSTTEHSVTIRDIPFFSPACLESYTTSPHDENDMSQRCTPLVASPRALLTTLILPGPVSVATSAPPGDLTGALLDCKLSSCRASWPRRPYRQSATMRELHGTETC